MIKFRLVSLSILLMVPVIARAGSTVKPKLRQLNVVFRHGDRTPQQFPDRYPNDPNMRISFGPTGSGGLTNAGKMRMYHLGEHLRNRYLDFLGDVYEEQRLLGVSSTPTRTKMSLQLVQAALYPPRNSSQQWHPSLNWQPIPSHHLEPEQNRLFDPDKCEQFIDELAKVMNSSEVQKKVGEYKDFLEEIRIVTGKKSPMTLEDVSLLHNNLEVEDGLNMTMKPWMKSLLKDERLRKLRSLHYEVQSFTDLLKRFNAGFLLRQITEDMLKARKGVSHFDKKTLLYSGHDKNILNILQALGVWDLSFPEFSSSVIFELWSQDEKYFVKVVHYLGIPKEFRDYTEKICGLKFCPLDRFIELTKDKQILDNEITCRIKDDSYFDDPKSTAKDSNRK